MDVRHHIRVIIIEPSAAERAAMVECLGREGYQTMDFAGGAEAFEKTAGQTCHLGIVSLVQPEGDGAAIVDRLLREHRVSAVVATSAKADFALAREAMRAGAGDLLTRPVSPDELTQSLERLCHRLGLVHTNEDELNRLIGQRIRTERLSQKLTLRQLSDRTNLTTSQLSQVELGKNAASIWSLARISNGLGKQMAELLNGL